MPDIFREGGFVFYFYSNEHQPEHCHVRKGDGSCKVNLRTLVLSEVFGLSPTQRKTIKGIVTINQQTLLEAWDGHFNK